MCTSCKRKNYKNKHVEIEFLHLPFSLTEYKYHRDSIFTILFFFKIFLFFSNHPKNI